MITFVIPSIGRETLSTSISSLENQTNSNWKAIIVFDGIEPTISNTNPKITTMQIEKSGAGNGGGYVRNQAMEKVDSEWIAFLDDDDAVTSDYVEIFNQEIKNHPEVEVIIFRMYRPNLQPSVLPPLETDTFHPDHVGISFAIKKSIFKSGLKFERSSGEDFDYLNRIRDKKHIMMISPHVTYLVHGTKNDEITSQKGNRVFINKIDESYKEPEEFLSKTDQNAYSFDIFLMFLFLGILFLYSGQYKRKNYQYILFPLGITSILVGIYYSGFL